MLSITPSVTQPNYEKKLAQSQGEKPATTIGNRTIGNNSLPEIRPSSSPTQQRMGPGPNDDGLPGTIALEDQHRVQACMEVVFEGCNTFIDAARPVGECCFQYGRPVGQSVLEFIIGSGG